MFEQQQVLGHLGRDPELRFTPTGQKVTNFTLAATRHIPQSDGETRELTVWYKITTWGKLAESCHKYLKKGRAVLVVGIPEVDTKTGQVKIWTDKDGHARANLGIVANTVKFIGKGADTEKGTENDGIEDEMMNGLDSMQEEFDGTNEDIPF